jgi:hypothetical protein
MADRIGHGIEIRRLYKIFGEKTVDVGSHLGWV